jgi:hypothetical protein
MIKKIIWAAKVREYGKKANCIIRSFKEIGDNLTC